MKCEVCGKKTSEWEIRDINNMPLIACRDPDTCDQGTPSGADPSEGPVDPVDPDPPSAEGPVGPVDPAGETPPSAEGPSPEPPVEPAPAPARGGRSRS